MNLIPQVTPAQLSIVRDNVAVLDVREPEEVACGQIPGSTNIPLGQLPLRLDELAPRRPIVVVCQSGRRSQHAAEMLTVAGFMGSNLAGGLNDWVSDGRSTVGSPFSMPDTLPRTVQEVANVAAEGPDPADLSKPRLLDPAELARRLLVREWVVDIRTRTEFAAGYLPGALNFELSDDFATYLGRLYDWGAPLTLIAETRAQIADARRQLMRVGIHRINGAVTGRPEELTDGRPVASYPVTDFAGLAQAMAAGTPTVLDVRRHDERAAGGVRDSLHVPVDQLRVRLRHVPPGEVWVYSGWGYRAAIAASILARAGYHPILVDGHYYDPRSGAPAVGLHTSHLRPTRLWRRTPPMCRAVACRTCGKTTWAGCGQHVDQVMSGVPTNQRCPGHQDDGAASTGWLARLFSRR
jgi:rhodanese-related sulfurtransferase